MIEYLDVEDVLAVATVVLGEQPVPRDYGLLASAVARPQTALFGQDAYPDVYAKAAALLHSLASNHPLVDGNKRTAWNAAAVFLDINRHPLIEPLDADKAERLVLAAAQSQIDVPEIAAGLRNLTC